MLQYIPNIFFGGIKLRLFNFDKPGPGVSKDAPRKKGIFLYFELLGRKFSKLFSLNMLYFVFSIPAIILYFLLFSFLIPVLFNAVTTAAELPQNDIAFLTVLLSLFMTIICTITLGSGPASASMAYVLREYSKEEHVWLFSEFLGKMKENFKKEIVVVLVDLIFVFFSSFAISFYLGQHLRTGSTLYFALFIFTALLAVIFAMMHYYIHQLIVTFENKLIDTYKNAFLLTLSSLLPCILLTAIIIVANFYLFNLITPIFMLVLHCLLLIAFFRFPVEFYAHSKIKKLMPKEEKIEEEPIFSDLQESNK